LIIPSPDQARCPRVEGCGLEAVATRRFISPAVICSTFPQRWCKYYAFALEQRVGRTRAGHVPAALCRLLCVTICAELASFAQHDPRPERAIDLRRHSRLLPEVGLGLSLLVTVGGSDDGHVTRRGWGKQTSADRQPSRNPAC
jgi:hypothetical protein